MARELVIVPTFNEALTLTDTISQTRSAAPDAHILIVDDASPDGTGRIADSLATTDSHVFVLHREGKQGLGTAYLEGFAYALERGYHLIAEMDADGSHDPTELPRLFELARESADLAIGSRWVIGGSVTGWSRFRRFVSRTGNRYARTILRSRIHDLTAGFRVFRASTLQALNLNGVSSQGYCFQIELAWATERAGLTVVEHPIHFSERVAGRSKMHLGIVIEALARVTAWGLFGKRGA
ncbi:MAG TPA: polyprenol monophosphomannose synthase [Terrimesophilobacter sp.]|nr:polyprenol monophosphomannose synthase [Terrimesophilobacter sp.]HRP99789.1 polyprenol monophosphomannose synthase [Terrimesophilobacter sp.]